MKQYKVGIIGHGVVGQGIHKVLKDDVVAIYDPAMGDVFTRKEDFKGLDLVVICVMTKQNEDGTCDTSIVESSLDWIEYVNPGCIVLIKSAVVPGEMARIRPCHDQVNIVVSPEYMGESKYFTPEWKYPHPEHMESHTWQIFGGEKEHTSVCVDIFKRHMGVDCVFIQTDLMTASLCKYMENAFFATKVTFCNEFFDIAKIYGVDFNELKECWAADPRVGRNHTLVFPTNRGYGGKCFPKDVKGIIADAKKSGYTPKLLEAVDQINEEMLTKSI